MCLGSNCLIIHAMQSNFVLFIHNVSEWGVPAKDVAIEVAQVALCCFIVQYMRGEALRKLLRRMVGHVHTHQVDKAENWLVPCYSNALDVAEGCVEDRAG